MVNYERAAALCLGTMLVTWSGAVCAFQIDGESRSSGGNVFSVDQRYTFIRPHPPSVRVTSAPSATSLHAFWARGVDDSSDGASSRRSGTSKYAGSSRRNRRSKLETSSTKANTRRKRFSPSHDASQTKAYYVSPSAVLEWSVDDDAVKHCRQASEEEEDKRAASKLVEGVIDGFIHRHALHTLNLKIISEAKSRSAILFQGKVGTVHATFDRMSFTCLKMSGGGKISAFGLDMNPASLLPMIGQLPFVNRWAGREPFRFRFSNCVLTQEDLRTSNCIKRGLTTLGRRVLKNIDSAKHDADIINAIRIDRGATLSVQSVEILSNSKISARGKIRTIVGSVIQFRVETSVCLSNGGHVLHFPGMQFILNPDTPLLEARIPFHLLHSVDLDLGDHATIRAVEIDGRRKQIRISGTVCVSPRKALTKASKEAGIEVETKRAKYYADVGQWLTNLGRFSS